MTNYRKFCPVTTTTCGCILSLIESSSFFLIKKVKFRSAFGPKAHCQKFTLSHNVEGDFTWLIGERIHTHTNKIEDDMFWEWVKQFAHNACF